MIEGLRLVQTVNEQLDLAGVTKAVLDDRGQLLRENQALKAQIDKELKVAERRFNKWMVIITATIVLSTAAGLVFQGFGTQALLEDHKYLHIQSQSPIFPQPSVTVNPLINILPDSTKSALSNQPNNTKE